MKKCLLYVMQSLSEIFLKFFFYILLLFFVMIGIAKSGEAGEQNAGDGNEFHNPKRKNYLRTIEIAIIKCAVLSIQCLTAGM